MKKLAAFQAYVRFVKTATTAGNILDSGKGSGLPPELRGAGVGALAGGIPGTALGGMHALRSAGMSLKNRLMLMALMGGTSALGGGLLGAGAGAIGRAATDPEDEDRLTGGSPIARGALLGGAGLGGVGSAYGAAAGTIAAMLSGHGRGRLSLPRMLGGAGLGAAAGGLGGGIVGGGLGAGAGALRKALSDKED